MRLSPSIRQAQRLLPYAPDRSAGPWTQFDPAWLQPLLCLLLTDFVPVQEQAALADMRLAVGFPFLEVGACPACSVLVLVAIRVRGPNSLPLILGFFFLRFWC